MTCRMIWTGRFVPVFLLLTGGAVLAQTDEERLQGSWRLEGVTGIPGSPHEVSEFYWFQIKGDQVLPMWWPIFTGASPGTWFKLLPGESPRQLEIAIEEEAQGEIKERKRVIMRGTYELHGDTLVVGLNWEGNNPLSGMTTENAPIRLRLRRVPAVDAKRVEELQGIWRWNVAGPGLDANMTARVVIMGEVVAALEDGFEFDLGRLGRRSLGFHLHPDPESPGVDLFVFQSGQRKLLPAIAKRDGEQLEVCFSYASEVRPTDFEPEPGEAVVHLERATPEEIASYLHTRAQAVQTLAARKRALQLIVGSYPATPAANTAQEELNKMPSDAEIREMDARDLLQQAEAERKKSTERGRKLLESLIERYPGTSAAKEAAGRLDTEQSEAAANKLRLAKRLLKANPGAGKRWLTEIVDQYEGTEAADEAKQLLEHLQ